MIAGKYDCPRGSRCMCVCHGTNRELGAMPGSLFCRGEREKPPPEGGEGSRGVKTGQ